MRPEAKMEKDEEFAGVSLNPRQSFLLDLFKDLAASFNKKSLVAKVVSRFRSTVQPQGVYLYGLVGRGKTMLMKMFYNELDVKKEIIHFQTFMQELHRKIHLLQEERSADEVIENLAEDIAGNAKVLCIDEFEINDITNAMVIMRLFSCLANNGVFIFLTTNTPPEDLYKDGIQRESFLPFIENTKKNFLVRDLCTDKDYRFEKAINTTKKILYPLNDATSETLSEIKRNLCFSGEVHSGSIELFGRKVTFRKTHQNILFTDFNEMFVQDLGYADYVKICQKFEVLVLENVRQIKEDETDIITRFINFIDNAYFYKILLFASFEVEPSLVYGAGKKRTEFQRSVSRLNEMNSINERFQ